MILLSIEDEKYGRETETWKGAGDRGVPRTRALDAWKLPWQGACPTLRRTDSLWGDCSMNKPMIRLMLFSIAISAAAMPLQAQMMADSPTSTSEAEQAIARVRTDGGVIMISDGGEFKTATQGQPVNAKSRLMVSKESSATVIYDDGCKQKYDEPGIYEISQDCVLPVAAAGGGPSKGLIIGGVLLGGAVVYAIVDDNNDDDSTPPPVSR